MIKANELRIGNLIYAGTDEDDQPQAGKVLQLFEDVIHWTFDLNQTSINEGYNSTDLKYVSPIPLTADWLERCGLPNDRSTIDAGGNYSLVFERREDNLFLISSSAMESEVIRQIEYVHIFQNIYFDLKGEKLQIKNI